MRAAKEAKARAFNMQIGIVMGNMIQACNDSFSEGSATGYI